MYYKQKSDIIYRDYGSFGYITDNRNFGYKPLNDRRPVIGDKILSESGNIFFSALSRTPQPIESVVSAINRKFIDAEANRIREDAIDFFTCLEKDGFVVSGETVSDCLDHEQTFFNDPPPLNTKDVSILSSDENNTQKFFDDYFKDTPQMTHLHIEITGQCNERCIHCYIPHEKKTNIMPPDMFYTILEQCRELNLLHITISGGEPMSHSHFVDFIKKCNEYNFSVNVLSNLTLLNDEIIEEMKENPILCVQTSLYAMNPDIHDQITAMRGSFEKTTLSILQLRKNNIPIQVSCPIMKQNIHEYKKVISWCKDHNINANSDHVIIGSYDHCMDNLECRLSIHDIRKIIQEKMDYDPDYLLSVQKQFERKKKMTPDDYICSICQSSLCISETGNIYPCSGWQSCIIGNIKTSSLYDTWFTSEKIKHLRNIRRKDFPKCTDCNAKEFCTLCMVRNANENPNGDPLIVNNYFCDIAKATRELYYYNSNTPSTHSL